VYKLQKIRWILYWKFIKIVFNLLFINC
jgi:hypothetical protein